MTGLTVPERLLQDLGITEPEEIDLEAIAYHVGAIVRRKALDGCEARIIGHEDSAIITVNSRSSRRRQRFSVAHELGHWHHHRGKCLVCRAEDYAPRTVLSPERVADNYAADLLMPHYLFQPMSRQHAKLDLAAVSVLADAFNVSHTAAAIRVVESDHSPSVLVCHTAQKRKWFARAPSVPAKWFPQDHLDAQSYALDVLFGRAPNDRFPHKIGADAWFDRWEAQKFELTEQSMRTGDDEVLTILTLSDSDMLEDEGIGSFRRRN